MSGDGVIVNRLAGDQCRRVLFSECQQFGDIFNRVLTVGIYLYRMAEPRVCRRL